MTSSRSRGWPMPTSPSLGVVGKLRSLAHKRQTAYAVRASDCHACGLCVVACPEGGHHAPASGLRNRTASTKRSHQRIAPTKRHRETHIPRKETHMGRGHTRHDHDHDHDREHGHHHDHDDVREGLHEHVHGHLHDHLHDHFGGAARVGRGPAGADAAAGAAGGGCAAATSAPPCSLRCERSRPTATRSSAGSKR